MQQLEGRNLRRKSMLHPQTRSPLLARLGCASEEERDKTDAIKAMKLTRNSSLAARESAVTLLTVLESPLRILLIIRKSESDQ